MLRGFKRKLGFVFNKRQMFVGQGKKEAVNVNSSSLPLPFPLSTLPPHLRVRNNDHIPHLEVWVMGSMVRGNDFLANCLQRLKDPQVGAPWVLSQCSSKEDAGWLTADQSPLLTRPRLWVSSNLGQIALLCSRLQTGPRT